MIAPGPRRCSGVGHQALVELLDALGQLVDLLLRFEILEIIGGHDSRSEPLSLNDMIVKDADKLWRYTKSGVEIDVERFNETVDEGLDRLRSNINNWFFTQSARKLAVEELLKRTQGK